MIFEYGVREMQYLSERDPMLGRVIERIGIIEREIEGNIFVSLVKNITGQQISNSALKTVLARLISAAGELTPENICGLGKDGVRACGMSMRKAENIVSLAEKVRDGVLDLEGLHERSDDEVIKALTELNGVGVWTAEMILIFSLCRPNVLSQGDFGVRRGIELLYAEQKLTRQKFREYHERYSPYASVASFYLWKVGNGEIEV